MTDLYERDFALWIKEQSEALRLRDPAALDWVNLLDEIDGLAQEEKVRLRKHLTMLCRTMLLWVYVSEHRCLHWKVTLLHHRQELDHLFEASPSRREYAAELLPRAFNDACEFTDFETGLLSCFEIAVCPWTIEQILDHDFLPRWQGEERWVRP
jgi:hypothetical protein